MAQQRHTRPRPLPLSARSSPARAGSRKTLVGGPGAPERALLEITGHLGGKVS